MRRRSLSTRRSVSWTSTKRVASGTRFLWTSTTAIDRVRTDALGPGQRFAIAKMEVCGRVLAQGNEVTIRWIPAHSKVAGKEKADELAKAAVRRSTSCSDKAVLDELAGNYYQLLSGHAAVGAYLKDKTEKSDLYRCWWCDTAER